MGEGEERRVGGGRVGGMNQWSEAERGGGECGMGGGGQEGWLDKGGGFRRLCKIRALLASLR